MLIGTKSDRPYSPIIQKLYAPPFQNFLGISYKCMRGENKVLDRQDFLTELFYT